MFPLLCFPRLCTRLNLYAHRRKSFPSLVQGSNIEGSTFMGLKVINPSPPLLGKHLQSGSEPCHRGALGSADRGWEVWARSTVLQGDFGHTPVLLVFLPRVSSLHLRDCPTKAPHIGFNGLSSQSQTASWPIKGEAAKRNREYLPGNAAPLPEKVKKCLFQVFFPPFPIRNILGPWDTGVGWRKWPHLKQENNDHHIGCERVRHRSQGCDGWKCSKAGWCVNAGEWGWLTATPPTPNPR